MCPSTSATSISKTEPFSRLERILNYEFRDRSLLKQALTHKSFTKDHNERLEFLGDAVLGYVVTEILFESRPHLNEDMLTLMRAELVRGESLAVVGASLELGEFLLLGLGERRSGGRDRASILANAVEAIIGAVSVDGGIEAARTLIREVFESRIELLDIDAIKDPKTLLQEELQSRRLALPVYQVVASEGSDHQRTFTVECRIDELQLVTTSKGGSRRGAEKSAAAIMLERMAESAF